MTLSNSGLHWFPAFSVLIRARKSTTQSFKSRFKSFELILINNELVDDGRAPRFDLKLMIPSLMSHLAHEAWHQKAQHFTTLQCDSANSKCWLEVSNLLSSCLSPISPTWWDRRRALHSLRLESSASFYRMNVKTSGFNGLQWVCVFLLMRVLSNNKTLKLLDFLAIIEWL